MINNKIELKYIFHYSFTTTSHMDELMKETTEEGCREIIDWLIRDVREFGYSNELMEMCVEMWKKLKAIEATRQEQQQQQK